MIISINIRYHLPLSSNVNIHDMGKRATSTRYPLLLHAEKIQEGEREQALAPWALIRKS